MKIQCRSDGAISFLYLCDTIGDDVHNMDVAAYIADAPRATEYKVFINSTGADTGVGIAIYNLLRATGKKITTIVEGIAASAAVLPFLAGDVRLIPKSGALFVHNPFFPKVSGDASALKKQADLLDHWKVSILSIYASRSKVSKEYGSRLMDSETWLTAQDALRLGFATEIVEAPAVMNRCDLSKLPPLPAKKPVGLSAAFNNAWKPKRRTSGS